MFCSYPRSSYVLPIVSGSLMAFKTPWATSLTYKDNETIENRIILNIHVLYTKYYLLICVLINFHKLYDRVITFYLKLLYTIYYNSTKKHKIADSKCNSTYAENSI